MQDRISRCYKSNWCPSRSNGCNFALNELQINFTPKKLDLMREIGVQSGTKLGKWAKIDLISSSGPTERRRSKILWNFKSDQGVIHKPRGQISGQVLSTLPPWWSHFTDRDWGIQTTAQPKFSESKFWKDKFKIFLTRVTIIEVSIG